MRGGGGGLRCLSEESPNDLQANDKGLEVVACRRKIKHSDLVIRLSRGRSKATGRAAQDIHAGQEQKCDPEAERKCVLMEKEEKATQ